jgi:hypothetical protein
MPGIFWRNANSRRLNHMVKKSYQMDGCERYNMWGQAGFYQVGSRHLEARRLGSYKIIIYITQVLGNLAILKFK